MYTKLYRITCLLMALGILLQSCNLASESPADAAVGVRVWFDAPLPDSTFRPTSPCQIVAHGASPSGIAMFELSVNGAATSIPSPDAQGSLVTLTQDCGLSEPGEYLLQLRAQDNAGEWSAYAETNLIIVEADLAAGAIGGAVFGDQNGNGLQDASEGPLEGVDVVLKGCGPDAMQTTGTDGVFQFVNVPAGSCTLEVFKAGWGFSGSSPSLGYPLPVGSDPSLPTNVGMLMAPMSDNLPEPNMVSIERISTGLVYAGKASCGTNEVTITARVTTPKEIKVVVLFYRFQTGGPSSEFQSVSMNSIGGNLYQRSLNPTSLLGGSVPFDQAALQYQVVVQQGDGDTSLRTSVMTDITVQACGGPSPIATTPSPLVVTPTPNTLTPAAPYVP